LRLVPALFCFVWPLPVMLRERDVRASHSPKIAAVLAEQVKVNI